MDSFFGAKKNFGFGMMRLPMDGERVDIPQTIKMVDAFLEAGFNYFDTAHGYLGGQSETALKEALTSRYPRDSYLLTNKLSPNFFSKREDIRKVFEDQLQACGVEYFDLYLMHAQSSGNYEQYQNCHAYEEALELKKEGKIRHLGISFHDTPEFLNKILNDHPEIEAVQIQFNYADYEDKGAQSRACYEVCLKHGKPCIIMEPVRGGSLAILAPDCQEVIDDLNKKKGKNLSPASYAVRFAASFPNNKMVLSGMSSFAQMEDNLATMRDFKPLDEEEKAALETIVEIFKSKNAIPCTGCAYCIQGCPQNIRIPNLFDAYNRDKIFLGWNPDGYYKYMTSEGRGAANSCIECGQCEGICPQKLPIRELLKQVSARFDK